MPVRFLPSGVGADTTDCLQKIGFLGRLHVSAVKSLFVSDGFGVGPQRPGLLNDALRYGLTGLSL